MINSLYNLTVKGLFKALSFILAAGFVALILLHANSFAQHFGGKIPYLALLSFYGMGILWIHGVGFELQSRLWRAIFLPLLGYLIVIPSIIYLLQT